MSEIPGGNPNDAFVYQSPIALTLKQIKRTTDSSLVYEREVSRYKFDEKTKNYDVRNLVRLQNNELKYRLLQFHFHKPAEHLLLGKRYAIELHFVFEDFVGGDLLVIAFLGKLTQKSCSSPLFSRIVQNKSLVIPTLSQYWAYPGSLTTDNRNFNIEWVVSNQVLEITRQDLDSLRCDSKPAEHVEPREGRDINLVTPSRPFPWTSWASWASWPSWLRFGSCL